MAPERRTRRVVHFSTLTCPRCGHAAEMRMPTDYCQFFYRCPSCNEVSRPRPEDCCVFCSYGTVRCPPEQIRGRHSAAMV